jgi:anti-anti-sigma regulatory factor
MRVSLRAPASVQQAAEMWRTLKGAISQGAHLTVDCTEATHLHAAVLQAIGFAAAALAHQGGKLSLQGVCPAIAEDFRIAGLSWCFSS